MRIQIQAEPTGPLRVIREFPDARLARLEGLNGIGKTLAVRLLEVCTGTLPYDPHSAAWASLRHGLGRVTIEATGLHGADRVVWVADTKDWESGDGPAPRTEWFKSITVDGQPATLDTIRQLVAVYRLPGDESIVDTFAGVADSCAATVGRWASRHVGFDQSPLAVLEHASGTALERLPDWSPATWRELRAEVEGATDAVTKQSELAGRLRSRSAMFEQALDLAQRLAEIRQRTPGLKEELDEIDDQISAARNEQEAAQRDVADLAAEVGRTEPLKKELRNARRTLARNRRNLEEASNRAAREAARLDLEPDPDAVSEHMSELVERHVALTEQLARVDAGPAMKELLSGLETDLADAESRGLGDEIVVEDFGTGLELDVSRTRAGVLARQTHLDLEPPPPEANEVSEDLARTIDELADTRELRETLSQVSRYGRLVNDNEERVIEALRAGAGGDAAEALERASNRRRASDQALLELAARRAAVAQKLGGSGDGASEEAIARRLTSIIEHLGIQADQLEQESVAAEEAVTHADREVVVAQERAADLRERLSRAETDVRRAVELVDTADDLAWVRTSLGPSSHLPHAASADVRQLLPTLERARAIVQRVDQRLEKHRNQLAAVERALREIARHVRGQTIETSEYVNELQAWFASTFSDWFNDPRVREELLANSTGDINVDLGTRQVTWDEGPVSRSRPLEAFSSGEQAFAYTRARLALLDDDAAAPANRLIVLDEFGAFIALDRLEVLFDFLRRWAAEHERDQVLVILPLSRDYADMARSAIGPRAELLASLAEQVERRSYVTRVLVP